MAAMDVDLQTWRAAAQVTVAMLSLLFCSMIYQGLYKVSLVKKAVQKKEKIERYTDPRALVVDRAVGNLLEWLPVFLGAFWISMVLTEGTTVAWGWGYVAFRALYVPVALNGGISAKVGPKPLIIAATGPAYLCLMVLLGSCIKNLFF